MIGRVRAHRVPGNGHIPAHGVPKQFGQPFVNGMNMHAVETLIAIGKFSIIETDVARQLKNERPLPGIARRGAFIVGMTGKTDQRQLARERYHSTGA